MAGPTPAIAICNECVELCGEILAAEREPRPPGARRHSGTDPSGRRPAPDAEW